MVAYNFNTRIQEEEEGRSYSYLGLYIEPYLKNQQKWKSLLKHGKRATQK